MSYDNCVLRVILIASMLTAVAFAAQTVDGPARILFQPPVLSAFLDGSTAPVLEGVVDLSIVVDLHARAWVGFTASTGGGYENRDILTWSFASADVSSTMSAVSSQITFLMSACLPGRNLCTPERAVVERSGAGYHLVLPANFEWGASIPNRREGMVLLPNARGIACWDSRGKVRVDAADLPETRCPRAQDSYQQTRLPAP